MPHAGGQRPAYFSSHALVVVSIHAPHAGGQLYGLQVGKQKFLFQYMPPTRGGNQQRTQRHRTAFVSIHAPHAGGQHTVCYPLNGMTMFQYMPPTRGGNGSLLPGPDRGRGFNTCPPRGGATRDGGKSATGEGRFQYMPPTRGATAWDLSLAWTASFQYMPPTRGGNSPARCSRLQHHVSIHAPHAGGQPCWQTAPCARLRFNTCPPRGGATSAHSRCWKTKCGFNTCPPRGGATFTVSLSAWKM